MAYEDEDEDYEEPEVEAPEAEEQEAPEPPPPPPPPEPEPEPEQPPPEPPQQYAQNLAAGTATDAAPEQPAQKKWYAYEDPDEVAAAPAQKKWIPYEEPDSPIKAFAREVAHGGFPAAAGAVAGAGTGAALGAAGFNPYTVLGGTLAGAVAGGYGAEAVQEKGLRAFGAPDDAAIRKANEAAHPWSTYGGKAASNIFGGAAGLGKAAVTGVARGVGAVIGGGWETGVAIHEGKSVKEAVPQVLSGAAGGAVFAGGRPWTRKAEQVGSQFGTAARPYFHMPVEAPAPAPPPPFDYGPKPEQGVLPGIGGGNRQTEMFPSEPPPLPGKQPLLPNEREPRLPLEPPPVVDAQGQYGFNITAPDIHSRSGMPPTSGVASEATPPTTLRGQMEAQPYSTEAAGRAALAAGEKPQQAAGINVMQPGQADPTVAFAQKSQAELTSRPSGPYGIEHPTTAGAGPPPPRTEFEPPRRQPPRSRIPYPPIPSSAVGPHGPVQPKAMIVRPPDSTQAVMQEPVVRPGQVRLYKGDPRSPTHFTTDRAAAEQFGPLRHVDVGQAQLQQQFRPGREPGSMVAHPVLERAYNKRLQPTVRMPTQPTQRQWPGQRPPPPAAGPPPAPPRGPPPGPPPPPARGGPGPAGRPPTGVREAGPRLDAEINAAVTRAVGQPTRGARAAQSFESKVAEFEALRNNPRPTPEQSQRRNQLLTELQEERVSRAKRGVAPPPKVDKVEQSVQRGRAAAEKINQREAAREAPIHAAQMGRQPPAAPPKIDLTVKGARERAAAASQEKAAPKVAKRAKAAERPGDIGEEMYQERPKGGTPERVDFDAARRRDREIAEARRELTIEEWAEMGGAKGSRNAKASEYVYLKDKFEKEGKQTDKERARMSKLHFELGEEARKERVARYRENEEYRNLDDDKKKDVHGYNRMDVIAEDIDQAHYAARSKSGEVAPPREKPPPDAPPKKFGVAPELAEAAKATAKAKAPKPASDAPRSLLQHIQSLGGIKPDAKGELAAAFGDKKSGLYLAIARKNGMPLDRVVENIARGAPEERYLPEGASIRELLDALKGSREHLPLGKSPTQETPLQRERADFEEARHTDNRAQVEKDIDAWVESPDHDYYDPGMRPRMVELMEQGKATDPADAHAKAVEEWDDRQRAFEGDVGPPKDIPDQLPDSVGADGKPQMNMFGDAPQKDLAQRASDRPLKPSAAQKGADEGLFGTPPRDQAEMPVTPKEPAKKDAKEIDRLQQKYFDAQRQLDNLEKDVKAGKIEDTDPKYLNARRAAEDAINAWHEAEGIPLAKPKEPLRSKVLERGRSGRPTKTTPLAIGSEEAILKAGYERATGPKEAPRPPSRQAAQRQGPEVTIKAFDADGNQTTFKGATAAEAVAAAKRAGHRDYQIYNADMTRYSPPKATAKPAAAAVAPPGGGTPPPTGGSPPAGGTPQPPRGSPPAATSVEAARKSILSHVADKAPWYSKIPTSKAEAKKLWRDFYTATKNALDPIEQLKKLSSTELTGDDDFYKLARLTKGLGGRFTQLMRDGTYDITTDKVNGKSLDAVIKPVADDPDGFTAYAVAKRVIELEGRGIKTGMNVAEARQVAAADGAKFEPVFRDLVSFQDRVLENLVKSGVLSDASAAKMRQLNKEYVPFYRMLDPDSELGAQLGSGLQTRNPIFRIKGSDKDVLDPITSVIKNTYVFTDLAHRNQVLQSMKKFNNTLPPDKQFMVRDRSSRPIEVQPQEIQKFMDKHGIEGIADDALTIFRPNAFQPADDKIRLYNNGKAEVYTVPKDIGRAINAMDQHSHSLFTKILATPASMLRAGSVLSPDFMLRNAIRDIVGSFVQNKGSIPVVEFATGLKHIFKRSDDFQEWQIKGGANANLVSLDRAILHANPTTISVANKVVNPKQWLEMLRKMSELSENATRVGSYVRNKAKGVGSTEAAFKSRESTLDFARIGSSNAIRAANAIIPFLNARVEGIDRAARAFRDDKAGFIMRAGLSVTLPSVALWFHNKDNERVKELPQWQKDLFWIFPTDDWKPMSADEAEKWEGRDLSKLQNTVRQGPNGLEHNTGTIYRVPKPFEIGVIFGSIPERMLDAYFKEDPKAFKNVHKTLEQAFVPQLTPQFFLPYYEQWANRSVFLDRNIETESEKKLPPVQRFGPHTSETAKLAAEVTTSLMGKEPPAGLGSPKMIDNYIRQWTGGLGNYVVQGIDMALKSQSKDAAPAPTRSAADMPVFKAFVARFPGSSSQSVQDFYDTRAERRMEQAGIKAQRKTDPTGASERAQKSDAFTGESFAKQLKADRDAVVRIMRDKEMSPDDKRAAIDLTYLLMIEHAKAGVAAFDRNKRIQQQQQQ